MDVPAHHVFFALICGLLLAGSVIELIRRSWLQERYAVLWLVLALIFMTYGWWLAPVAVVASWFRIGDVVPVVLFLGVFMCALLILQLCVKISEFSVKIKNLVQEVSMLRHELERREPPVSKAGGAGDDDIRHGGA